MKTIYEISNETKKYFEQCVIGVKGKEHIIKMIEEYFNFSKINYTYLLTEKNEVKVRFHDRKYPHISACIHLVLNDRQAVTRIELS